MQITLAHYVTIWVFQYDECNFFKDCNNTVYMYSCGNCFVVNFRRFELGIYREFMG